MRKKMSFRSVVPYIPSSPAGNHYDPPPHPSFLPPPPTPPLLSRLLRGAPPWNVEITLVCGYLCVCVSLSVCLSVSVRVFMPFLFSPSIFFLSFHFLSLPLLPPSSSLLPFPLLPPPLSFFPLLHFPAPPPTPYLPFSLPFVVDFPRIVPICRVSPGDFPQGIFVGFRSLRRDWLAEG